MAEGRINSLRFPYAEERVDEWFAADTVEGSVDWKCSQTQILNCNTDEFKNERQLYIKNKLNELNNNHWEDYRYFFHGTKHGHAQDIIEHGIDLDKGKEAQDFSNGGGFYLSERLEAAIQRAEEHKMKSEIGFKNGAILIYARDDRILDKNMSNGLDLRSDNKLWEEVVTFCRSREGVKAKDAKKLLKTAGFVIGPVCDNGGQASKGARTQGFPRAEQQLCIRDRNIAAQFDKLLVCAIFL